MTRDPLTDRLHRWPRQQCELDRRSKAFLLSTLLWTAFLASGALLTVDRLLYGAPANMTCVGALLDQPGAPLHLPPMPR